MSVETTTTTADGVTLLRRAWDPDGDPRAVVLIVHGLGEHSGRYEHVGEHFAAHGLATRSFDLRGFGRSGGKRAYVDRFDQYLDDVAARLDWAREPGRPVVLLGHSLGGLIAARYLQSDRPQPDAAVLSAPALVADVPALKRGAAKGLSRLLPTLALPNDIAGDQLSSDPAVGEAYFADPLVYTKTTARLGAEILAAIDAANASLDRIRVPLYVIHGGADTVVPPPASAPLAGLPDATRRLFPAFRHECFNEPAGAEALDAVAGWVLEQVAGPD